VSTSDNCSVSAPVGPGDILADKYEVERVLGQGGMGVVVAARHIQLGQRVALKFMLPEATRQPGAADRFLREARAAVKLRSEHVARVLDVGTLTSGAPYTVMEFLEGSDLGELLHQRGPLPPVQAVTYILQACLAMDEAHAQGIVHRDLKPENLFLTRRPDGRPLVKVLDFGISKLLDGGNDLSATRTGMAMGSPAYMAPEQMRSAKDVDARADIWSLGAVLFQLLSGQLPYQAETFTEMMARVLTEEPRVLWEVNPNIDPRLGSVIRRCLERDLNRRIQTIRQLVAELAPFGGPEATAIASSLGPTAVGLASPVAETAAQPNITPPAVGELQASARPAKTPWVFVAIAAVAAAAVGAFFVLRPAPEPSAVSASDAGTTAASAPAPPARPIDAAPAPTVDAADPAVVSIDAAPPPPDASPPAQTKKRRKKKPSSSGDDDPFGSMY